MQVNKIIVLGGGSAGFVAAMTLKIKLPRLDVTVIRSKEIGIIGVGEGTTITFPKHLHRLLGIGLDDFYKRAEPQWKLGIKFEWGPTPAFYFPFRRQVNVKYDGLSKEAGYYFRDSPQDDVSWSTALMHQNRAFARQNNGLPAIDNDTAYHIENEKLVEFLESHSARVGVKIMDDTVAEVFRDDHGITGLRLNSGPTAQADLFVDCSGFYSVLLGKTLSEPYIPFKSSLYCDRAVVGGWERGADEPIQPYTTAETMESGWAWRIDHETRINRGYVYSTPFISDADAEAEFRRKNPKVGKTRIIKFMTGRYRRSWVKNVVAIGNSCGFVEPLQATSLDRICTQSTLLVQSLIESDFDVPDTTPDAYSAHVSRGWDGIRFCLALHYKYNTRLDTAFWRECREKTEIGPVAEFVRVYQSIGPSSLFEHLLLDPLDPFGNGGHLNMLVGMRVPYRVDFRVSEQEKQTWAAVRERYRRIAAGAFTVEEALKVVRAPGWRWPAELYCD